MKQANMYPLYEYAYLNMLWCRSDSDQDNSDSSSQSLPQPGAPEGHDDGADLLWQCKQLAKGVYGLPEAIGDIRELKIKLATVNADRAGKLSAANTSYCCIHCWRRLLVAISCRNACSKPPRLSVFCQ